MTTREDQHHPDNPYKIGQRIDGYFEQEQQWFPGKIQDIVAKCYHIKYDDGEEEEEVPASRLRKHVLGTLSIGSRIRAYYGGGRELFEGTIQELNDDSTYDIIYDDGDEEKGVSPSLVLDYQDEDAQMDLTKIGVDHTHNSNSEEEGYEDDFATNEEVHQNDTTPDVEPLPKESAETQAWETETIPAGSKEEGMTEETLALVDRTDTVLGDAAGKEDNTFMNRGGHREVSDNPVIDSLSQESVESARETAADTKERPRHAMDRPRDLRLSQEEVELGKQAQFSFGQDDEDIDEQRDQENESKDVVSEMVEHPSIAIHSPEPEIEAAHVAVDEFLTKISHCWDDMDAQKTNLSSLLKLTKTSDSVATFICQRGGHSLVLSVMQLHDELPVLQSYGSVLLRKLCIAQPSIVAQLLRSGIVEVISSAMVTFPRDAVLQASSCGVLSAVISNDPNHLTTEKAKPLVERIFSAVLIHRDINRLTRQVHVYACEALIAIVDKSKPEVCYVIAGPKEDSFPGIMLLLQMLHEANEKDTNVHRNVCALLLSISVRNQQINRCLRESGSMAKITEAMEVHRKFPVIAKYYDMIKNPIKPEKHDIESRVPAKAIPRTTRKQQRPKSATTRDSTSKSLFRGSGVDAASLQSRSVAILKQGSTTGDYRVGSVDAKSLDPNGNWGKSFGLYTLSESAPLASQRMYRGAIDKKVNVASRQQELQKAYGVNRDFFDKDERDHSRKRPQSASRVRTKLHIAQAQDDQAALAISMPEAEALTKDPPTAKDAEEASVTNSILMGPVEPVSKAKKKRPSSARPRMKSSVALFPQDNQVLEAENSSKKLLTREQIARRVKSIKSRTKKGSSRIQIRTKMQNIDKHKDRNIFRTTNKKALPLVLSKYATELFEEYQQNEKHSNFADKLSQMINKAEASLAPTSNGAEDEAIRKPPSKKVDGKAKKLKNKKDKACRQDDPKPPSTEELISKHENPLVAETIYVDEEDGKEAAAPTEAELLADQRKEVSILRKASEKALLRCADLESHLKRSEESSRAELGAQKSELQLVRKENLELAQELQIKLGRNITAIENLTALNKDLKRDLEQARAENVAYRVEIGSTTKILSEFQQRHEQDAAAWESKLQEASDKIHQLQQEKNEMTRRFEEAEKVASARVLEQEQTFRHEISSLQEKLKDTKHSWQEANMQAESFKIEASKSEQKHAEVIADLEGKHYEELNRMHEDKLAAENTFKEQIAALESELQVFRDENTNGKEKIRAVEKRLREALEKSNSDLKVSVENLKESEATKSKIATEFDAKLKKLKSEVHSLRTQKKEALEAESLYKNRILEYEAKLSSLNNLIKSLREEAQEVKTAAAMSSQQQQALDAEKFSKWEQETIELQKERNELRSQISVLETEAHALRSTLASVHSEFDAEACKMREDLSNLKQQVAASTKQRDEYKHLLDAANGGANEEVEYLRKEQQELKGLLDNSGKKIQDLKSVYQKNELEAQKVIANLKAEIQDAKAVSDRKEEERAKIYATQENAEKAALDTKTKLDEAEAALLLKDGEIKRLNDAMAQAFSDHRALREQNAQLLDKATYHDSTLLSKADATSIENTTASMTDEKGHADTLTKSSEERPNLPSKADFFDDSTTPTRSAPSRRPAPELINGNKNTSSTRTALGNVKCSETSDLALSEGAATRLPTRHSAEMDPDQFSDASETAFSEGDTSRVVTAHSDNPSVVTAHKQDLTEENVTTRTEMDPDQFSDTSETAFSEGDTTRLATAHSDNPSVVTAHKQDLTEENVTTRTEMDPDQFSDTSETAFSEGDTTRSHVATSAKSLGDNGTTQRSMSTEQVSDTGEAEFSEGDTARLGTDAQSPNINNKAPLLRIASRQSSSNSLKYEEDFDDHFDTPDDVARAEPSDCASPQYSRGEDEYSAGSLSSHSSEAEMSDGDTQRDATSRHPSKALEIPTEGKAPTEATFDEDECESGDGGGGNYSEDFDEFEDDASADFSDGLSHRSPR